MARRRGYQTPFVNEFQSTRFPGPRRIGARVPLRGRMDKDTGSAGTGGDHTPSTPEADPVEPVRQDDQQPPAAHGSSSPALQFPDRKQRGRGAGSSILWMVLGAAAVVGLLITYGGQYVTGQTDSGSGAAQDAVSDRTYSYYHDSYYDSESYSSRWEKDGTFEREDSWTYDGAYDYEGYGSAGMRDRAKGKASDPLLTPTDRSAGVFEQYGLSNDPTAGEPVGPAWQSMLDPTYSPYAGYSNPYANRIAMSFGEGTGRGAYLEY